MLHYNAFTGSDWGDPNPSPHYPTLTPLINLFLTNKYKMSCIKIMRTYPTWLLICLLIYLSCFCYFLSSLSSAPSSNHSCSGGWKNFRFFWNGENRFSGLWDSENPSTADNFISLSKDLFAFIFPSHHPLIIQSTHYSVVSLDSAFLQKFSISPGNTLSLYQNLPSGFHRSL